MRDPLHPERDQGAISRGERLRDEGMANVQKGVDPVFRERALDAIHYVAEQRPYLSTDPVRTVLVDWQVKAPRDWRVLGPYMQVAAREGWIQKTGHDEKSAWAACHRRDKPVYRSLIYRGAA